MATIKFVKYIKTARKYETVEHDRLDLWTWEEFEKNGMFESLKDLEYVHLYFDFDFHFEDDNVKESVEKIVSVLDELKPVFGDYHYAGYCCDYMLYFDLVDFNDCIELKDDSDLGKKLSFHVVYPETRISQDELCDIMTSNNYSDLFNNLADGKVYKNSNKEQLLRHPYAHKYQSPNSRSDIEKKGVNFEKLSKHSRPSHLVATPRGTERIVSKDKWSKVFTSNAANIDNIEPMSLTSSDFVDAQSRDSINTLLKLNGDDQLEDRLAPILNNTDLLNRVLNPVGKLDDDDSDFVDMSDEQDNSANMTLEMFEALYKGFDGLTIHGDVENVDKEITLYPLMSALFKCINGKTVDDDDVSDALDFIKEHANLTPSARAKWSEKRKQARSNDKCRGPGSLFTYLKQFNPMYFNKHIRPLIKPTVTVEFNLKDDFTIKNIREKGANGEYQINGDPKKLNYTAVLNDLKRVLIVVDKQVGLYYFKRASEISKMNEFEILGRQDARHKLQDLHIGTEAHGKKEKIVKRTALDVFEKGANNSEFYRSDVMFYSEKQDVVSFYQGLKYQPVQNDDLIKPFNDHILNIICKGNVELYTYLQSWFATIVQTPDAKTGTALIIKGSEGTGKNTMTDVWCELLCGYANKNADIDSFAGKYNTGVENTKLAVFNEVVSADIAQKAIFSSLKKLITESTYDLHAKFQNVLQKQQNVLNMIFLSNEFNPVAISSNDRRYVVLTPSDEHMNDPVYFDPLYSSIKVNGSSTGPYREDFMCALTYYYTNYHVQIKLTKIPETDEKKLLRDNNRPFTHYFIANHMNELMDGVEVSEIYNLYTIDFKYNGGYGTMITRNKFVGCMSAEYCDYVQIKKDGKRPRCLRLKNNERLLSQLRELRSNDDDDE